MKGIWSAEEGAAWNRASVVCFVISAATVVGPTIMITHSCLVLVFPLPDPLVVLQFLLK